MRKKTLLAATVASIALTAGLGATAAHAAPAADADHVREGSASAYGPRLQATEYPGGGTWVYGVWDGKVHSIYDHGGSTHRASVKSSGKVTRSDWMPPRSVAVANRPKALSGNQAFWATRG